MANALASNDTIIVLDIDYNEISDQYKKAIEVAVTANKDKMSKCSTKIIAPMLHGAMVYNLTTHV